MRAKITVALLTGALGLGVVTGAGAQCTTDDDANAARKSVKKATTCNDKRLRSGPTAKCTLVPPPACAGSLATDAVALAYGPNNPPAAAAKTLPDQRRCQKQIGKGVTDFVKKLVYITRGLPPDVAQERARKSLDKVVDRCAVPVAADTLTGVVLPAVGPQCAAAIGDVGDVVDAVALRDCL